MVNRKCEVVSCSQEVSSTVSLHQVPRNDTGWDRSWLIFLKIANSNFAAWKPTKKTLFICSRHFKRTDIRASATGKQFITNGCHPSINDDTDISDKIYENLREGMEVAKRGSETQFHPGLDQGFEIDVSQPTNQVESAKPDEHKACNEVIEAQVKVIAVLNSRISSLNEEMKILKADNEQLRRSTIQSLKKKIIRRDEHLKRKSRQIDDLKLENKKVKLHLDLPEPATKADSLLLEFMKRRNVPHTQPYSTFMKTFAFNCHYLSPKGYSYLRHMLPTILPDPTNCQKWTKDVIVQPGLLPQSLHEVGGTCQEKKMYYSLAFDEVAIRQQIVFDGQRMLGTIDYGGLVLEGPPTLAKSALFCLVTEINGSKSFPLAYLLTDGLKSEVLAQVVQKCIQSIEEANGNVLSVSFDGLRANFKAMEQLGACLTINSNDFQPFIQNEDSSKRCYLIPDAAHMFKLVRNTLERHGVLFNSDMKEIRWDFVTKLHMVQEREQLRAGNKLTSRDVNFQQKKMNVKLCVQVLSNRTATAIDFCRNIGMDGFEGSEATTEFLRINNFIFDLLNTRPFGQDCNEPLNAKNEMRWSSLIASAKQYYIGLQIRVGKKLVPVYQSKNGTFVKGIITALTSVECIMSDIMKKETGLLYLPTYRLSQDPLEVFFGCLRRRLGCNDNPNASQLAYTVKGMLCFKLSMCTNGNCDPQEDLFDKLSTASLSATYAQPTNDNQQLNFDDVQFSTETQLSLFVENIVVYIAGFVGKRISERLHCGDCLASLNSCDDYELNMREDFTFLLQADKDGLFKPSEDLVHICKITEKIIRIEQSGGIFHLDIKRVEILVKRECIGKNIFSNLHREYSCSVFRQASFDLHFSHKFTLISEICRMYRKVRLHYIAKRSSLIARPVTNRNTLNNIVQFTGY